MEIYLKEIKTGISYHKRKEVIHLKDIIIKLDRTNSEDFTHIMYNEVIRAIEEDVSHIVTPITSCFSHYCVSKGYKVIVKSGVKEICLNDLIGNGEIRYSQSAEKMLLSGCFGLAYIGEK